MEKFIKRYYKQVMVIAVIPWSFIPILLAPDAIIKIVIAYDDVIQYGMLEDDVYEIMEQYAKYKIRGNP